MRKLFLLLFILALCIPAFADGWVVITEEAGVAANYLSGVHFLTDTTGYAVGEDRTAWKTTDGGLTWNAATVEAANYDLSAVYFVNANTGFATQSDNTSLYPAIYKITNDGSKWQAINYVDPDPAFNDIQMVDSTYGWAAAVNGKVYKTSNGGDNWTQDTDIGLNYAWEAVHFTSANGGCVVGSFQAVDGLIYKRTGGIWEQKEYIDDEILYGLHFAPNQTQIGFAVGESGTVLKTTNGGNSWTPYAGSFTTNTLNDVYFVNTREGWVVGDSGTIFSTSNGGSSWTNENPAPFITSEDLKSVYFYDRYNGWAVGGSGYVILKYVVDPVVDMVSQEGVAVSSAPPGWTGNVIIYGSKFQKTPQVTMGADITVNSVTYLSDTQLRANISVASNVTYGWRTVKVYNPGYDANNGQGQKSYAFEITHNPEVEDAVPQSATAGTANLDVDILGKYFREGATVSFSSPDITVHSSTFDYTTQVTANISIAIGATPGPCNVTVTNHDSGSGSNNVFTISSPEAVVPVIVSVSPETVVQGFSGDVVVAGDKFESGAAVAFSVNGITVNTVTFDSDKQLTLNISVAGAPNPAPTGARTLIVTNPTGGSAAKNNALFVTEPGVSAPTIENVVPNSAYQGEEVDIVISGKNISGTAVSFIPSEGIIITSPIEFIPVTEGGNPGVRVSIAIDANAPATLRQILIVDSGGYAVSPLGNVDKGFTVLHKVTDTEKQTGVKGTLKLLPGPNPTTRDKFWFYADSNTDDIVDFAGFDLSGGLFWITKSYSIIAGMNKIYITPFRDVGTGIVLIRASSRTGYTNGDTLKIVYLGTGRGAGGKRITFDSWSQ